MGWGVEKTYPPYFADNETTLYGIHGADHECINRLWAIDEYKKQGQLPLPSRYHANKVAARFMGKTYYFDTVEEFGEYAQLGKAAALKVCQGYRSTGKGWVACFQDEASDELLDILEKAGQYSDAQCQGGIRKVCKIETPTGDLHWCTSIAGALRYAIECGLSGYKSDESQCDKVRKAIKSKGSWKAQGFVFTPTKEDKNGSKRTS